MVGFRPNPIVDELFVIVGQMHEGRKILTEPDWIDNREADLPWRERRNQPQHEMLNHSDRCVASFVLSLQEQRRRMRIRDDGRQLVVPWLSVGLLQLKFKRSQLRRA